MPKFLPPPPALRQPDPRALRVPALCKNGTTVEGEFPLASMSRLADGFVAAADGSARWSLQASTRQSPGREPQLWARLQAHARVPLQCQRCLAPLLQLLEVDQLIRFVESEELAAQLDEESEEDVMSLPAQLNVYALLEDELILALPIVPRHEGECPQPLLADGPSAMLTSGRASEPAGIDPVAQNEEKKPHPFAALAAFKVRKSP